MENYNLKLLIGKYGLILKKHKKLALISFKTFKEISEYINQFKKYDNWTFRDIDKVCALKGINLNNADISKISKTI